MFLYIIYIYYSINKNGLVLMQSNLDNNYYYVRNTNDKKESVDKIARIKFNLIKLLDIIISDTQGDNSKNIPIDIKYFENARSKLNITKFSENTKNSEGTSYNVNKGEEIILCLKSKKNATNHDDNIIMYVAIHELAHVVCPEIGHTKLFNSIFAYMLKISIQHRLYKYQDYSEETQEYCGIEVDQNILNL